MRSTHLLALLALTACAPPPSAQPTSKEPQEPRGQERGHQEDGPQNRQAATDVEKQGPKETIARPVHETEAEYREALSKVLEVTMPGSALLRVIESYCSASYAAGQLDFLSLEKNTIAKMNNLGCVAGIEVVRSFSGISITASCLLPEGEPSENLGGKSYIDGKLSILKTSLNANQKTALMITHNECYMSGFNKRFLADNVAFSKPFDKILSSCTHVLRFAESGGMFKNEHEVLLARKSCSDASAMLAKSFIKELFSDVEKRASSIR